MLQSLRHVLKNLPRSWKNLPRSWKKLQRFSENLLRFWGGKYPLFFTFYQSLSKGDEVFPHKF